MQKFFNGFLFAVFQIQDVFQLGNGFEDINDFKFRKIFCEIIPTAFCFQIRYVKAGAVICNNGITSMKQL